MKGSFHLLSFQEWRCPSWPKSSWWSLAFCLAHAVLPLQKKHFVWGSYTRVKHLTCCFYTPWESMPLMSLERSLGKSWIVLFKFCAMKFTDTVTWGCHAHMWPSKGMKTAEVKSECWASILARKQSKKVDRHHFNKVFVNITVSVFMK